jgi:hypothetical protein
VLGHLCALIPRQRSAQLIGQLHDRSSDGVADRLGTVSCKGRAILDSRTIAMPVHAGQVQEHREPRGALHEGANRRAAQPEDQVSFPMARDSAIGDIGRPLADHDLLRDETLAAPPDTGSRNPERSPSPQACRQFTPQSPPALHEQRLVDRLV